METRATAPGKIILFGEHAVVYGQPAIAAPVTEVEATCTVRATTQPGIRLSAPDLGISLQAADLDPEHHFAVALTTLRQQLAPEEQERLDRLEITIHSQIPIASGLGSGAAIAAVLLRALALHVGREDLAQDGVVSEMTYAVEKIHHGTPSGIDNSVVSYAQPIYFVRTETPLEPHDPRIVVDEEQQPEQIISRTPHIQLLTVGTPLILLIADTGIKSSTREAVLDLRRQWEAEPARFEAMFEGVGILVQAARLTLERGMLSRLGELMTQNHDQLRKMTVSSPELDRLVEAALDAGALGAKMSGGGRGGNMIALVDEEDATAVEQALLAAGAVSVLRTVVA